MKTLVAKGIQRQLLLSHNYYMYREQLVLSGKLFVVWQSGDVEECETLKLNASSSRIVCFGDNRVAEILTTSLMSHCMDESGSPKKKGRPPKYATQEERRLA